VSRKRDYYEVLGIQRGATDGEIKKAFRAIALEVHPDKAPGDPVAEERFKEANEAYAVLSDPDRRAAFDRFGHAAFGPPGQGSSPPGAPFGGVADVFDALGELFGRRKGRSSGRDLRYTLEVSFEEAAFGATKSIRFPTRRDCESCDGSGARSTLGLKTCGACAGRGEVRVQQGFFSVARSCTACSGAGKIVTDPCKVCDGAGTTQVDREFTVKIPAGTDDGTIRRVPREGEPGRRGGSPGDLQVVVRVQAHPLLARQGHDITCDLPITFPQAALGTQVTVPTLDGKVNMKVPEGTQSGRTFRLRGKGIPRGDGKPRGDQLVRIVVETPTSVTPRMRQLLEEIAREQGKDVLAHPKKKKFLEKVRELFDV
jgi:molecular chaperone DnaJ